MKSMYVWAYAMFLMLGIFVYCLPAFAFANSAPIGYFDGLDSAGNVAGWTLDPDTPSQAILVHFYADGPLGGGGTLIGYTTANLPRPDVNQTTGYPGDHGFVWKLFSTYLTGWHHIYAYGIDSSGAGANPLLTNSPRSIGVQPNGNARISGSFDGSPIVISTSNQFAGAIDSLTWNGMQFIDAANSGRLLQSAVQLDNGGEGNNPTEGGSLTDNTGPSTSVLHALTMSGNVLQTQIQMAYWEPLGGALLSNDTIKKQVTIGFRGIPNVVEYLSTFTFPDAHSVASFEGITGYMPSNFSDFWTYDPRTKTLYAITAFTSPYKVTTNPVPANPNIPVIISTSNGKYAMAVYSPDPVGSYYEYPFNDVYPPSSNTSKWDCDRLGKINLAQGDYTFSCYIAVGSLRDVETAVGTVYDYFNPTPTLTPTPTPPVR